MGAMIRKGEVLMLDRNTDPVLDAKQRDEVAADPNWCDYGQAVSFPHGVSRCSNIRRVCRNTSGLHPAPPAIPHAEQYRICRNCRNHLVNYFLYYIPVVSAGGNFMDAETRLRYTIQDRDDSNASDGDETDDSSTDGDIMDWTDCSAFPPLTNATSRATWSKLCRVCEDDEIKHFQNFERDVFYGLAYPPPRNAFNGHQNTCTCLHTYMLSILDACLTCQRHEFRNCFTTAGTNLAWLRGITRANNNVRIRASDRLKARRRALGKEFPCRCGRDTDEVDNDPYALFCLVCQGVWIHLDFKLTGPGAIRTRWSPRLATRIAPRPANVGRPGSQLAWGSGDDPTRSADHAKNSRRA